MPKQVVDDGQHAENTLRLLDDVFREVAPTDFGIRLWDGTPWGSRGPDARFTIVLRHPGSLRQMFVPPTDLNVGEAYIYDDFDVEGDIETVGEIADRLDVLSGGAASLVRYGARLLRLPTGGQTREGRQGATLRGRTHSKQRDAAAIRYHYDVSNDFYALWLDRNMVYSCAYFESSDEGLDTAQERKLDYICRKLRLQPGERLLDIGCGWGGLVMHAARHYGVDATGITLSEAQASLARERIADAGLADRCRVEVRDYRDVDESRPFDKLVSVGMFEHVGAALLETYFAKAYRLLRPGGVFLNHGISTNVHTKQSRQPTFSEVYVFPDGQLLPIATTLAEAEGAGFEVRDVESLREHYALTLRRWVRRLEDHAEEARAATDDVTYRIWRLFMSVSAYQFDHNQISVYQTLLAKPDQGRSGLPLTRQDWYPA
jgi:cyclopropane-fatty-acyl-phospholipid synthase